MSSERQSLTTVLESLKRYITLNIDYARLTAAEKASVLLSAITFYTVLSLLGLIALFFLSFGIGYLLTKTIAPTVAYIYVAGFYVLLGVLLFIFRRKLFIDPMTRFVTRLFLKPPQY